MILSNLEQWNEERGAFSKALRQAVRYLKTTDFNVVQPGRYDLIGDDMFALVQLTTTVTHHERKSEHHRTYIDVQMVVTGEEIHYVARQSERNVPVEDKLEDCDYALYDKVENEYEIRLLPGNFVVYFPDDLHRPACCHTNSMETKRVVIKINKKLLLHC